MAYARWGKNSDIYFYCHDADEKNNPGFECASCCLSENKDKWPTLIRGFDNAIAHIQKHIDAGDDVEDDVIPMLKAEAAAEVNLDLK